MHAQALLLLIICLLLFIIVLYTLKFKILLYLSKRNFSTEDWGGGGI